MIRNADVLKVLLRKFEFQILSFTFAQSKSVFFHNRNSPFLLMHTESWWGKWADRLKLSSIQTLAENQPAIEMNLGEAKLADLWKPAFKKMDQKRANMGPSVKLAMPIQPFKKSFSQLSREHPIKSKNALRG